MAYDEKISGVQGYDRPRRGSGERSPAPDADEFTKISKKHLRKLKNALFFPIYQKKVQSSRLDFCGLGRKIQFF